MFKWNTIGYYSIKYYFKNKLEQLIKTILLEISFYPFDPWEPEFQLKGNTIPLTELKTYHMPQISIGIL